MIASDITGWPKYQITELRHGQPLVDCQRGDMDDLGGMDPDRVHTQKLVGLLVADHFDFAGDFVFCVRFPEDAKRELADRDIVILGRLRLASSRPRLLPDG